MRDFNNGVELSPSPTNASDEMMEDANANHLPAEDNIGTDKWQTWISRTTLSPVTIETDNASPSPVENKVHAEKWLAWITTLVSYQQDNNLTQAKIVLSNLWLLWARDIVLNVESTEKPNYQPEAMLGIFSKRMHQLHQEGKKLHPSMTIDSLTSYLKENIEERLKIEDLPNVKEKFLKQIKKMINEETLTTKNLKNLRKEYKVNRIILRHISNASVYCHSNLAQETTVETAFYSGKETKKIYDKAIALAILKELVTTQQRQLLNERSVSIG